MKARAKASLLWGLVGALAFLVLVQGYRLLGGRAVGIPPLVVVALVVGALAAGLSYLLDGRLRNQSP